MDIILGFTDFEENNSIGAAFEDAQARQQMIALTTAMKAENFPAKIYVYCLAQVMLETNWLTSNVAKSDNNLAGIKWLNKPYQKATRGLKANDGGYYAHYANYGQFFADYRRVLSIGGISGRPIDASSAKGFIDALRSNEYFTDPNYHTKFNAVLRKVNSILDNSAFTSLYAPGAGTTDIKYQGNAGNPLKPIRLITAATESVTVNSNVPKPPESAKTWWDGLPWYGKGGIILGSGLIVLSAVKN